MVLKQWRDVEERLLNKKPLLVLRSMSQSGHVMHMIILIGIFSLMGFVSLVNLSLWLIDNIEPLVAIGKCINDAGPMEDLRIINGM